MQRGVLSGYMPVEGRRAGGKTDVASIRRAHGAGRGGGGSATRRDRKSTRLNSRHTVSSSIIPHTTLFRSSNPSTYTIPAQDGVGQAANGTLTKRVCSAGS